MNLLDQEPVCWADIHPKAFERRLHECPVAYVPFGSLEWHGHHMPYGVDTDKAQAIVERVARRYGGIVVPGIAWGSMHGSWRTGTHPGLSKETRDAFYTEVFRGLVEVGFEVLVGVSGHWTSKQTSSIRRALEVVAAESGVRGLATFDGSDPHDGFPPDPDLGMDHAGALETSIFLYLFPDRVKLERLSDIDLSDLPGEECHLTHSGIQGENPLRGASEERGRRHVEKLVPLIGQAALGLLRVARAADR